MSLQLGWFYTFANDYTLLLKKYLGNISNIIQITGGTRIGSAMNRAIEEFEENGRSDVQKMMVVLTDGQSNDSVIEAANEAK